MLRKEVYSSGGRPRHLHGLLIHTGDHHHLPAAFSYHTIIELGKKAGGRGGGGGWVWYMLAILFYEDKPPLLLWAPGDN